MSKMALHDKVGSSIEQLIAKYTERAVKEATKGETQQTSNKCTIMLLCVEIQLCFHSLEDRVNCLEKGFYC